PKEVANYLMVNISGYMNDKGISINEIKFKPEYFKDLLEMIDKGTISKNIAKTVIAESLESGKKPSVIVKEKGLIQITDTEAIEKAVDEVINENPKPVSQYISGKTQVMGFLIGQVMKKTRGKANPKAVSKILSEKLNAMK
ncbi:MAG: Asp-tRNA(Asn)/Glu-tRNA(Gln) amidotransferase GatCAB subunit B, partial [Caldisericaceae bacterium]|nr:Asp-tRNA(Asn)/Glu-tRNA(Gln) amidotransferase GatCAB subunit B [Caldisericaceae bacterium]